MVSKTLKNSQSQSGFSLIELLMIILLIGILTSLIIALTNPTESRKRARDQKRLNDIATLERVINEFLLDNNELPGTIGILRTSTSLPTGNVGPFESTVAGWIDDDVSAYSVKLPIDPFNDETYKYSYIQNGTGYELNAVLESYEKLMQDDGGNNTYIYESGSDLSLL